MPKVFIVVLNYNECPITLACVESLQELSYPNYEVIIVDNGSTDNSVATFRSAFPTAIILETGKNLGYTGGNNVGIKYALEHGADYVTVLNPDTIVVNPDFITQLTDYMESHMAVGIVGPKVYWHEKGVIQNTILTIPNLWKKVARGSRGLNHAHARSAHLDKPNLCSAADVIEVEAINGVCIFVRASFFKAVGYLDEDLFIYVDEADLGYRARKRGWKIMYVPIESIIHLQKKIGYEMISNASFLQKRNTAYLLKKMGKKAQAWLYAFSSLSLMFMRTVIAPFQGKSFGDYSRFCHRLLQAYVQLLFFNKMVR